MATHTTPETNILNNATLYFLQVKGETREYDSPERGIITSSNEWQNPPELYESETAANSRREQILKEYLTARHQRLFNTYTLVFLDGKHIDARRQKQVHIELTPIKFSVIDISKTLEHMLSVEAE